MSFSGTKGYLTKPKPGVMLNPLHPLSRGLVGYWLFNEGAGSLANDISGYGNHGRLINMPPNVQGSGWGGSKFGGGLQFDGSNDYVDCGDIDIDGNGTITAWIYPLSTVGNNIILGKAEPGGLAKYMDMTMYNDDGILTVCLGNNLVHQIAFSGLSISSDVWQFVSVSVNGTYINFQVDGSSSSVAQTVIPAGNNNKYSIGRLGNSNYWYFNGYIDSVCIYNHVLSMKEINTLYQDPFCNLLQVPIRRYSVAAPPVGAIINQFQRTNLGADLYNGAIIL